MKKGKRKPLYFIKGNCPLCRRKYHSDNRRSYHHTLPKRHYPNSYNAIEMCDICHRQIEQIIIKAEGIKRKKLPPEEYSSITEQFLRSKK